MNNLVTLIEKKRQQQPILLMTHIIYGYPSIDESLHLMEILLTRGIAILEVQFPFSDPVADGPVITNACHSALENKPKLAQCIADISELSRRFPGSAVVLMSYLNPLLQYRIERLAMDLKGDIKGLIVPDLPIDQHRMLKPLEVAGVDIIWLFTPNMLPQRVADTLGKAKNLLYCVSRRGVTGGALEQVSDSNVEDQLQYLRQIKEQTNLPLALGFGIATAVQISELIGLVDVVVVGSALLKAYTEGGEQGFIAKVDVLIGATH